MVSWFFQCFYFFFFNDTATTEIYTLSLHDALPFQRADASIEVAYEPGVATFTKRRGALGSEEHTSELQSRFELVCRLLPEKKKRARRQLLRDGDHGRQRARPECSRNG